MSRRPEVLAVAAVGLIGLMASCRSPGLDDAVASELTAEHRALLQAVAPRRPFAGRLSGLSVHRSCALDPEDQSLVPDPLCSPRPAGDSAEFRSLADAERGITAALENERSPANLHAAAVRDLVLSTGPQAIERAVSRLQEAIEGDPGNPWIQNDLAVAQLRRARVADTPSALVDAFDAALAAHEADPGFAAASFNLALTLEALHLHRQAVKAWNHYLEIDPESAWSGEARSRLDTLSQPDYLERWETVRAAVEDAADDPDRSLDEDLRPYLHPARKWAEDELIPQWAGAELVGDRLTADRSLGLARQVGASLARLASEQMVARSVAAIDEAPEEGRRRLARGHDLYQQALVPYKKQAFQKAEALFIEARDELAAGGSPFVGWAEFKIAVCQYQVSRQAAELALLALRPTIDSDHYPALLGRTDWVLGLLAARARHYDLSLERYRSAEKWMRLSSGVEGSVFVGVLFTEIYTRIGQPRKAWESLYPAVGTLAGMGYRDRFHPALRVLSELLLEMGRPRAALEVAEELRDHAAEWSNTYALAEASLERAEVLHRLGRPDEALEDLEQAASLVAQLDDGSLREQTTALVDLELGRTLATSDPLRAVDYFRSAETVLVESEFLDREIQLLRERSRADLAMGDPDRAVADLEAAIAKSESTRADLMMGADRRRTYFEQAQASFDSMIALQLDERDDPEEAFRYSERARARLLQDAVMGGEERRPIPSPDDVVARLPSGTTLIEYVTLPDRIAAWRVDPEGWRVVSLPVTQSQLAADVDQFRRQILRSDPDEAVRRSGAQLFDLLLAPLLEPSDSGRTLVIATDGPLHALPFAALVDVSTGRFLIEDYPLSMTPSSTAFLLATERARAQAKRSVQRSLLAVGAPDSGDAAQLPVLASAEREARDVAALYEDSSYLAGPEATRDRFLAEIAGHTTLHFAGHALLNARVPLRSALLLTADGEETGRLTGRDIGRLDLRHTELVVLSACSTAGTGESREGPIGLALAFLAAGVPGVIGSLWDVEDEATHEYMTGFHRAYADGASPQRAAQLAARRMIDSDNPNLRKSIHWAGFSFTGGCLLE